MALPWAYRSLRAARAAEDLRVLPVLTRDGQIRSWPEVSVQRDGQERGWATAQLKHQLVSGEVTWPSRAMLGSKGRGLLVAS